MCSKQFKSLKPFNRCARFKQFMNAMKYSSGLDAHDSLKHIPPIFGILQQIKRRQAQRAQEPTISSGSFSIFF
jgi:hypothetical protein